MDSTREIELKILAMLRIRKNWFKYKPVLQPPFFGSEETRQVFYSYEKIFSTYEVTKISISSLRSLLRKWIRDKSLKGSCLSLARKLKGLPTKDGKVFQEILVDFAKRQLIKLSVTEGIKLLEEPNLDLSSLRGYLDKASTLNTDTDDDLYHYFKDPKGRIVEEIQEKRTPTGIEKLDECIDGGMSPGELLVLMGPPGRGKTTALINLGVGALQQGMMVLHITLEISARKIARRYDMRISGRTFESLRKNSKKVVSPLAKLKREGCDLVIKDWSMESPKVSDIHGLVLNYQGRKRKKFDLIIVDYADLLTPDQRTEETRFGLEKVYTDLRRLGNRLGIPIYTASQSNRESMNKMVVGMKDVAESFGKVKVADVVIGICQSPEEEEEKLVRLFIAKSRKKSGHPSIRLEMDPDKMWLGELGGSQSVIGKTKFKKSRRISKDWKS